MSCVTPKALLTKTRSLGDSGEGPSFKLCPKGTARIQQRARSSGVWSKCELYRQPRERGGQDTMTWRGKLATSFCPLLLQQETQPRQSHSSCTGEIPHHGSHLTRSVYLVCFCAHKVQKSSLPSQEGQLWSLRAGSASRRPTWPGWRFSLWQPRK